MPLAWHQYFRVTKGSRRIAADGQKFHSRAEMVRYNQLCMLQKTGAISQLRRQVPFPLVLPNGVPIKTPSGKTMRMIADFVYRKAGDAADTVEESKPGFFDRGSQFKIAVFEAIYGVRVRVTGQENKRPRSRAKGVARIGGRKIIIRKASM